MELHDAGHEADPTIPRLNPISLRNYFRHHHAKPKPRTPAGPTVPGDGPP
jgi:hypothetical protein